MDHLMTAGALGATRSATAPAIRRGFYVSPARFRDDLWAEMNRRIGGKSLYKRARDQEILCFLNKIGPPDLLPLC
jgi:hypothetical protein